MPTTELYFTRHGETEYNRRHIVQGRKIDSSLNATGRRQAQALAERLTDLSLDAIYASTLTRARETAACIAEHHPDVPLVHLNDLEEMSWGVHEGDPPSEATDAIYARWERGEFDYTIEQGESILDVQERGLRAVRKITRAHEGETVLVVAHGRLLRIVLASLLDDYGLERMQDIKHDNTAINHLICKEDGCYEATLLNCTAHLNEPHLTPVE